MPMLVLVLRGGGIEERAAATPRLLKLYEKTGSKYQERQSPCDHLNGKMLHSPCMWHVRLGLWCWCSAVAWSGWHREEFQSGPRSSTPSVMQASAAVSDAVHDEGTPAAIESDSCMPGYLRRLSDRRRGPPAGWKTGCASASPSRASWLWLAAGFVCSW